MNEFIHKSDAIASVLNDKDPTKLMSVINANLLRNIKDLYILNEGVYKVLFNFRNELNSLYATTGQTKEIANKLDAQYSSTIGSLEERLKKISEQDAKEREKLGDSSFYE